MAVVIINVTDTHIKKGQADPNKRCRDCPIYLAAKQVIPNLSHVSPNALVIFDESAPYGTQAIELPALAKAFVRKADTQANVAAGRLKPDKNDVDQEPLKPFRFRVQIP